MNYESVIYEKKNGIAKIILNRHEKYNAMNRTMVQEMGYALDDAKEDNAIRVVVIAGKGKAFCTGIDLKFMQEEVRSSWEQQELFRFINDTVTDVIARLSKPVIASVNGFALAGGFEIMLACDLVIASQEAIIGDQHINFGLVGPGGSTQRTPRVVGIRKAKEIIFTGKWLSAQEAERIGLVNRVVPLDQLEAATNELATTLAEKSPVALRIAKMLINRAFETDFDTAKELEIMSAVVNATTEDFEEGMRAFSEKRKPVFKGRK